jgi:hypothetical protein
MRIGRTAGLVALALLGGHLIAPSRAEAYLDPGSGSFLFQMLVAAILGAGFTLRMQWKKVKSMFSSSPRDGIGPKGDE